MTVQETKNVETRRWYIFWLMVAIPLILGMMSAFVSKNGIKMYASMTKPALSPPAWVFPVVWSVMYLLMGIASWYILISEAGKYEKFIAMLLYAFQLFFNITWPFVFFSMQMYFFAFIWLTALWCVVVLCMLRFYTIRKTAGILLLPYTIWLLFAGYLNLGVYLMNRPLAKDIVWMSSKFCFNCHF